MQDIIETEIIKTKRAGMTLTHSTLFLGDSKKILKQLPDNFFKCCVTSPPYWGKRDYGIKGQIGAEDELQEYIVNLVEVFQLVKEKLAEDGTLWINIGDSYTSGNRKWRAPDKKNPARAMSYRPNTPEGLKPKDLIGIPWRLAFALQDAGWYLRSDIIWHKPNCQPESVKDRPTQAHEYIFMFSKSEKYYYDFESIKEPTKEKNGLRNKRSVWEVPVNGSPVPHYATFPSDLIVPIIKAGSKEGDFVLDPFIGSGTVGEVCLQQSRKFVGIEIKEDYINIARSRVKNASIERIVP